MPEEEHPNEQGPVDIVGLLAIVDQATKDRKQVSIKDMLEATGQRSFGPFALIAGLIVLMPVVGDFPGATSILNIGGAVDAVAGYLASFALRQYSMGSSHQVISFPMSPILLERWQFTAAHSANTPIMPDGCRDLIVKTDTRGNPTWFISQLAETTHWAHCTAGQTFMGFRLHSAVQIVERELLAAFEQCNGHEGETKLLARLEEFVRFDANLAEVLEVLATAGSYDTRVQEMVWCYARPVLA